MAGAAAQVKIKRHRLLLWRMLVGASHLPDRMKKKPKQKPARSMFAVFIMEDENGFMTIRTDYIGQGVNSFDLGMEILGGLHHLESTTHDKIHVERTMMSSYPN